MSLSSGKIQELDALHREVMGLKERRCFICKETGTLQVAHIIGRAHHGTRWDTAYDGNCHRLCDKCHRYSEKFRGWYEACYEGRTEQSITALQRRSRQDLPLDHLAETEARLRKELAELT